MKRNIESFFSASNTNAAEVQARPSKQARVEGGGIASSSAPPTASASPPTPPGLGLHADFITAQEEKDLISYIDSQPWSTKLSRRTQHYGYEYDYAKSNIDPAKNLGPFPELLAKLAQRLVEQGILKALPDQAIVNGMRSHQLLGKDGVMVSKMEEERKEFWKA